MDAVDLWLIDLADYLMRWHPGVWNASAAPAKAGSLLWVLRTHQFGDQTTLAARVHEAWTRREALLGEANRPRETLALHLNTLRSPAGARLSADARSVRPRRARHPLRVPAPALRAGPRPDRERGDRALSARLVLRSRRPGAGRAHRAA